MVPSDSDDCIGADDVGAYSWCCPHMDTAHLPRQARPHWASSRPTHDENTSPGQEGKAKGELEYSLLHCSIHHFAAEFPLHSHSHCAPRRPTVHDDHSSITEPRRRGRRVFGREEVGHEDEDLQMKEDYEHCNSSSESEGQHYHSSYRILPRCYRPSSVVDHASSLARKGKGGTCLSSGVDDHLGTTGMDHHSAEHTSRYSYIHLEGRVRVILDDTCVLHLLHEMRVPHSTCIPVDDRSPVVRVLKNSRHDVVHVDARSLLLPSTCSHYRAPCTGDGGCYFPSVLSAHDGTLGEQDNLPYIHYYSPHLLLPPRPRRRCWGAQKKLGE